MTSHLVETVRDIPLIVEREPMHVDYDDDDEFDEVDDDSGFPFDREPTRRTDSVLEDIARRHPEFAEHLGDFNLGRRNREPPTSRFTDRPFGTRFGANFPFDRDTFFEDDFHNIPRQQQSPQQQQQQQQQKQPNQETQGQSEVKSENSSSVNQQKSAQPSKIQQSNTVDLGQKQEPINDRNQRSMSAPPTENRGQQPRFFSSINIPINKEGRMEDMGGSQSQQTQQPQQQSPQPSQQQSSQNRPTERVIPIHVEGRDEPVIPKHAGPSFTQQPPQPERIFTGQRPSHFQQFREPRQFASPQYQYYQHPPQQQQPQPSQQPPQPSQQQNYQQQQQQKFQQQQQQQPPPKQEEPAAASPPPQPKTPIDVIQSIQKDVSELMAQIEQFNGKPKDKQYLYLDEMLTRNLIKLDNVDTQGQENIRQARKEAIKCIQKSISILEAKAAANVGESTPSNTESAESTTTTEQKMETEPVSSTTQEAAEPTQTSDEKSETNKMEVQTSEVTTTENKEPSVSTTEEKMDVEAANNQETKEAESTTTMTPQQQQESTSDSQQTKKSQ